MPLDGHLADKQYTAEGINQRGTSTHLSIGESNQEAGDRKHRLSNQAEFGRAGW
jgi:hypothetical protein